ncbi:reverse transcriptase domain-containing protein [Tanacetum coccineum]
MDDNRTMAQLLEAPTEGYEDAIVVPEITANNFEIKHGLLNLVQNKQFFGHDKEDPHAHIRYFNKITSTMKFPNVPSTSVKLMLFPFSLEGAARIWLEKEPPRSILTWDDLVSKFINKFFPPSKTTNLRNEITRFQQKFDETFYEAWDRFNDLLRGCPHHGFSELHQLDTFYNALNSNDQDSLNSAAGGNFLDKMPRECLKIIDEHSPKVRQSRSKAIVSKTFKVGDTKTLSYNIIETVNRVDVIDIACEEYVQEVLETSESGNPTSTSDLTIDSRSPSFTPFGGSDFLMEEIDEFLERDDSIPPGVDGIYDSEGDTVYLEELLSVINSDPNLPPSPVCEINVPEKVKSSCEDPPDLELKDLPSHLEYAFLEGDDKLPFCTHKILMEENAKPVVQHQRRVNPKIHEVIKQEVIKLLDAGLIYPISDSPWVSPVHCVPKKGGITVVKNEDNELIPTRHVPKVSLVAIFQRYDEKTLKSFMDDFSVFGTLSLFAFPLGQNASKGIVLGHKISKSGIEVDKAKVDVIAKLPHPTTDFSKIARPMTHLLEKETPFIFSKECIEAFETLKMKLTQAPILVAPDWDLPFEIMCDASDFAVGAGPSRAM